MAQQNFSTFSSNHPALQLFIDRPDISAEEWCNTSGFSRRSYYLYKSRAQEMQSAQTAQPGESASNVHESALDIAQPVQRVQSVQRTDRAPAQKPAQSAVQTDALGTALVHDVQKRNALLIAVFALATSASVENMYRVVATFTDHMFSNIALTGVFALSGIGFMLAGLKNRATVAIVASLVIFEAICNASSIFGGLYDWRTPNAQPNEFLHRVHTLVHFVPLKNVAQCIALFSATAIASVQFFAIREVRPTPKKKSNQ